MADEERLDRIRQQLGMGLTPVFHDCQYLMSLLNHSSHIDERLLERFPRGTRELDDNGIEIITNIARNLITVRRACPPRED